MFKTLILKSSLCDYSDAYILVEGTISITPQVGANPKDSNNEVVFKIVLHLLLA